MRPADLESCGPAIGGAIAPHNDAASKYNLSSVDEVPALGGQHIEELLRATDFDEKENKRNQMISRARKIFCNAKFLRWNLRLSAQTTPPVDAFDNSNGTFCGYVSIFS